MYRKQVSLQFQKFLNCRRSWYYVFIKCFLINKMCVVIFVSRRFEILVMVSLIFFSFTFIFFLIFLFFFFCKLAPPSTTFKCFGRSYHFKFFKGLFHIFYLVHSWIPWPKLKSIWNCRTTRNQSSHMLLKSNSQQHTEC